MRKPTKAIQEAAQRLYANAEKPQTKQDRDDFTAISEAGFCPYCAEYDGSLQPLAQWEEGQNPEEYSGSECCTCEEFVVWGRQNDLEYVYGYDGPSDADPGL